MDKKIIPVQISPGQMGTITLSTPGLGNQQTPPALAGEQVEATGSTIKEEIVEEILTQEEVKPLSTRVATDGNRQVSFEEAKAIPDPEERQAAYYKIAKTFEDYEAARLKRNKLFELYKDGLDIDLYAEQCRMQAVDIESHEQEQLEAAELLTDRDKQQEVLFPIATCSSMNLFTRYEAVQLLTDEGKKQTAYINLGKGLNQYQLKEHQEILLPIASNENVALAFRLYVAKQISNEEDQQRAYSIIATSPYTKDNYKIIIEAVGLITNSGKQAEALFQIIEQTCFDISETANNKDIKTIRNVLKKLLVDIYPLLIEETTKRLLIFKMITNKKIPNNYCKKKVEQHETNASLKTQLLYDIEHDQVYQVQPTKSARNV